MSKLTAGQKFGLFVPQLIALSVSTTFATLAAAIQAGPLMIPVCAIAIVSGVGGGIMLINKAINVDVYGWPELPERTCKKCAALAKEVKELREALVTLQLPEVRS
jgi:hypothetical protein